MLTVAIRHLTAAWTGQDSLIQLPLNQHFQHVTCQYHSLPMQYALQLRHRRFAFNAKALADIWYTAFG